MILAPDQRALYLEALRPPEGYAFDCGIGTTFSLDLFTLLVAPVSLALLEVEDAEEALRNPVLLLEGIRRYAKDLTILCQAARIAVPRQHSPLLNLLEPSVVEVEAPFGGVFHPKVWLLRYEAEEDDSEAEPLYRLLNLTRNLTFDRSWDLMLRLEGYLATHRQLAYARNHPLGDFVKQLPDMALHPLPQRILNQIDLLQDEVRRVDFQTPEPFFDHLGFYPAGIPGRRPYRFYDRCDRALVISPFLSDRMLRRITEEGSDHVLISRPDSLGGLKAETRAGFDRIYVLHDMGLEEEEADPADEVGQPVAGARPEPLGLHAKLFVVEAGWDATWLLGSANATWPAFYRENVEFMVELKGRRSDIGIDEILGQGEEKALSSVLRVYAVGEPEDEPNGDEQAERLANAVRDWLLDLDLRLEVEERAEGGFGLTLHLRESGQEAPPGDFDIACWPISLPSESGQALTSPVPFAPGDGTSSREASHPDAPLLWEVSRVGLTSFIAFKVEAGVEGRKHTIRFTLNLPISGLPQDREDHIFCAVLSDPARFVRYLRMVLMDRDDRSATWADALTDGSGGSWGDGAADVPLLRELVRALSRSPDRIDHIARVVARLQRTPQGREALPEDFQLLWDAIEEARSELE